MKASKFLFGLLSFAGVLFTAWFLLPVLTHRLFNIGNATGLAVSLLLLVYSLGHRRIHRGIRNGWRHPAGKVLLSLAGACAAAVAGLTVVLTGLMIAAMANRPAGSPTAVVLGCRVYSQRASLMLRERIDAAYRYLSETPDAVCVLSGGQGPGEDISEAECMYRALTEKGIAPERLFREERSTSTRENLQFSRKVIEKNGLNPSVAIVTNEFHEYRAARIAEKAGLEAAAVNGHTAWWLFPTYYVRELYGIVYELFL